MRDSLERFMATWTDDPTALAARYVETFDLRRRAALELTYYAHGDTRERGMALLRLKKLYRSAGLPLESAELPDHLTVMLAFAALADDGRGEEPDIADLDPRKDRIRDLEQVVDGEVVDVRPAQRERRSRSSASSVRTRSIAARSRVGRSRTYSAMAARATSCIERPSSAALRRSASLSASVRRRFIATPLWYHSGTTKYRRRGGR